jgi:uncharacterized protein (TIGR02270 family)
MGEASVIVSAVLDQHLDELIALRGVRSVAMRSPHVELLRLARLDERLAAHLDGLAEAGEAGLTRVEASLDSPQSVGSMFTLAVCALQSRNAALIRRSVALAATLPEGDRGLLSALGWASSEDLQGTVRALLGSTEAQHRAWGLAACAMHRVDPGPLLTQALQDSAPSTQARAWRVAGQMGRRGLADAARFVLSQPVKLGHEAVVQAASWALTLWGAGAADKVRASLLQAASSDDKSLSCEAAHRLATITSPMDWGRDQVRARAPQAEASAPHKRRLLRMAGWVGDVQVIPWLMGFMADDEWARLAGESFSLITGADLAMLDLERKPPEAIEAGPNDKPDDDNVAMDEDDSLPWPDQAKVQAWWQANAHRFAPGQRYFVGEPPSPAHCIHVLKTKGQRQRIMAAEYLCLLRPGSKLFPVAAPAWRQSRWLAEEEAALSAAHAAGAEASP